MCAHVRMYLLIVHKKEKYIYSEMDIDKNKRIGLTDRQVKQSREQHGKNVLTPPQRTSLWKLYLDKYRDPIIQILLVAAFVSLILAFSKRISWRPSVSSWQFSLLLPLASTLSAMQPRSLICLRRSAKSSRLRCAAMLR